MHTAAEQDSDVPVGPPSRWAPRNGPRRSSGRAASSRGDPPSRERREKLRQRQESGGQDPAGRAAAVEPPLQGATGTASGAIWSDVF
eukprot:11503244-Alexandrium_andersonii.AAC.1